MSYQYYQQRIVNNIGQVLFHLTISVNANVEFPEGNSGVIEAILPESKRFLAKV